MADGKVLILDSGICATGYYLIFGTVENHVTMPDFLRLVSIAGPNLEDDAFRFRADHRITRGLPEIHTLH